MIVVYGLAAAAVFFVLWMMHGVRQIGQVSRGARIEARTGQALLLIDLQTVFWEGKHYEDAEKTRAKEVIEAEVAQAKDAGVPVIALRQEWSLPTTRVLARLSMKGAALAGSAGTEIAAPFDGLADHVLVKRVQDGFETGALDALLADLDVGALRIVGLDGIYCVAKTAQAAQRRGYQVTLVTGGILAADQKGFAQMIKGLEAQGIAQV